MKVNANALVWAGVLAIAFVVAGSSPAQAQSITCPINLVTGVPQCPVCPNFVDDGTTSCAEEFTNTNNVCVTEVWDLDTKTDQCTGRQSFFCTLDSKTKDPTPCALAKFGDPTCEQKCLPVQ